MISTRKQEIEELKKKHAKEIRKELKEIKIKLEQDRLLQKAIREQEMQKLSELEELYKDAKTKKENFKRSEDSRISKRSLQYLEKLKEIQKHAKEFRKESFIKDNFPKPPALQEHSISIVNKTIDHIRIPVLVPKSILRKSLKLKPPTFNRITKNGEVLSVHLLTESMPTFDPLVSAEAKIPKKTLGLNQSVIADISHNFGLREKLFKSVSPIKCNKESILELVPPEGLRAIREHTPKEKLERYSFRDCGVTESTNESQRSWVAQRMKSYAMRIKEACKPQISQKKQLEMEILREKGKKEKPFLGSRVKIQNYSI